MALVECQAMHQVYQYHSPEMRTLCLWLAKKWKESAQVSYEDCTGKQLSCVVMAPVA